jgi:hypothetical protein
VYTQFVDLIGEDSLHDEVSLHLLDSLPNLESCIDFLYPPEILLDSAKCLRRAFLSPRNAFVDDFNNRVLDNMPGECCASSLSPSLPAIRALLTNVQTTSTVVILSKKAQTILTPLKI